MTSFGYCQEAPAEWSELLAIAVELDTHSNFDSFWIADSLLPNGPEDQPKLDAWTALAAIAHATSRVRLGMMVSGNPFRHPAVLAKTVTTIDHISGGRVTLGIGAGWPGEHRRYGIDFWSRPERLERLEEAVQVIKLLWTQDRPVFAGKYYSLDAPPYRPENVQRPHPPILIGGGSNRMLRTIARHADLVSPMIDIAEARQKVDAYCGEFGRDPAELRWVGGGQMFMHDDPLVQERAIAYAKQQYGVSEERIREGLFGSVDDVRAAVRCQVDAGASEIVLFQLPSAHLSSLRRFSEDVIPRFK